jgi:hypothetical protein
VSDNDPRVLAWARDHLDSPVFQDRRVALEVLHGKPERLPAREEHVLAFRHSSQEAAEAYADSNRNHHGHPAWVEQTPDGWLSVVDLRPAVARAREEVARV